MTERSKTYAIVGAGLAGAKAAETLREEGFDGRLVLVGEEEHRPYERPPLSKDYLRGEADEAPFIHDERFYATQEVELLTATGVSGVDLNAGELLLGESNDDRLRFDRLLLATGSVPRRLDVPGCDLEGIHYLRTLDDSARIGEQLDPGRRVVVVGSGWIGAEVAASAREKGCQVTMIETASLPLERVLGPEVGRIYLDLHRNRGVEFLPETTVERFEGRGSVERVLTRDGALIDTDLVIVGIGVAPRAELAQAAGLKLEDGVAVDEHLRTSAPGVFAAGDVASPWHPFYRRRLRVEHWANALNQGPAAARAMLGREVTCEEIPYFFSDQYDVGMEYSGYAAEWDEVVFRGDPDAREFIAFWLEDERVKAAMSMNVWDSSDEVRALIRSRRPVASAELADPDTPLSALATGAELHLVEGREP